MEFNPSPDIIHDQKTIYGSWVTSTWLMEELVERLVRWNLHPAELITHRFALDKVGEAYALMASGKLRQGRRLFRRRADRLKCWAVSEGAGACCSEYETGEQVSRL